MEKLLLTGYGNKPMPDLWVLTWGLIQPCVERLPGLHYKFTQMRFFFWGSGDIRRQTSEPWHPIFKFYCLQSQNLLSINIWLVSYDVTGWRWYCNWQTTGLIRTADVCSYCEYAVNKPKIIPIWNVHTGNMMNLWLACHECSCSKCSSVARDWLRTVFFFACLLFYPPSFVVTH